MTAPRDDPAIAAARQTLANLDAQARTLRAELAALHRDLAQAKEDFSDSQAARLLEANEQLVHSALRARELADTALADLDELSRASQFDELTDTPNRALMLDRVETAIAQARRHGKQVAVLFIDLDGFKQVNDTLGHAAGDEALRRVALRLAASVRETDTVSRFGGDEFLVLLAEVSDATDVARVTAKMLAALAKPGLDGTDAAAHPASIGIALYPGDADDARALIARADAAMYRAKRHGGARFEFHSDTPRSTPPSGPAATQPTSRPAVTDPHPRHLVDLREANESLVLSAVAAHALADDAQAVNARQVKILATVAHELRNPLMPLRTVAELLRSGSTDPTLLDRLQVIILRQVGYMARLVDDLLDGARAGTGKFRLERSRVDMNAIIRQAIDTCRPAMEERKQRLAVSTQRQVFPVDGDPLRLSQVVVNLLDNASKYTPEGGHITLVATESAHSLAISVRDDGVGITAAALPRIFDLFVQEAHARSHHGAGLGIGLAIVQELTTAHGGTIVVRSAGRDLGSEFVVTLPRMAAAVDA